MGCRMAPPYANIFLDFLDHQIVSLDSSISSFKRFIDDIFFLFSGTAAAMSELVHRLNELHPTIKYTLHYSHTSIDFLDLHIYLDHDRRLRTSLYRKPTDCQAYLHSHSFHPPHTISGIVYSQALRYNRLIDNDTNLAHHLNILSRALIIQGYSLRTIHTQIHKALTYTQEELLQLRTNEQTFNHKNLVILPYSSTAENFATFLKQHTAQSDEHPDITVVFSRNNNIGDLVTNTYTPPPIEALTPDIEDF